MDQTQNISDERLKVLEEYHAALLEEAAMEGSPRAEVWESDHVASIRELLQARRDLEATQQELRLQKGANAAQDERERNAAERLGMIHSCDWPEQVADDVESLRASHKRAVDVVRRAASINDGHPHNKWVRALGIQARAALAEAAKLEGK